MRSILRVDRTTWESKRKPKEKQPVSSEACKQVHVSHLRFAGLNFIVWFQSCYLTWCRLNFQIQKWHRCKGHGDACCWCCRFLVFHFLKIKVYLCPGKMVTFGFLLSPWMPSCSISLLARALSDTNTIGWQGRREMIRDKENKKIIGYYFSYCTSDNHLDVWSWGRVSYDGWQSSVCCIEAKEAHLQNLITCAENTHNKCNTNTENIQKHDGELHFNLPNLTNHKCHTTNFKNTMQILIKVWCTHRTMTLNRSVLSSVVHL